MKKTKNEKEIPPYLKDFLNVKKKNPINDLEAVQTDTEIRKEETQIKVMKKEETKVKYNSIVDELTKLGELKEKGLLTEEEFNEQKKKLLKQ